MALNSQYLKSYHQIEKALWSFFSLFGDLCGRCAQRTRGEAAAGRRKDWPTWCCCMIDNQVQDNWESLNAVQSRSDRNWYEPLRRTHGASMPGNGPCPALGETGCRLKRWRPITCTTQLCARMLSVLNELGLVRVPAHAALQIEDLIALPDILPSLYGTGRVRKVSPSEVQAYLAAVQRFRDAFAAIPEERRRKAIAAAV